MRRRATSAVAWFAAAATLLAGPPAFAERSLTLDEALVIARAHNRDLRAAQARLEQSATGIEQAWAALLPQVVAQGKYTHNYKEVSLDLASQLNQGTLGLAEVLRSTSTDPAQQAALAQFEQRLSSASGGPAVMQKGEQLNAGITATVPIIVPYAYLALASARQAHAANEASFSATETTVLLAVAQTFYAAAGADELLLARSNAVTVATQTLDNARVRFDAGATTNVDVMRAELAIVRGAQGKAEAEDAQSQAYRALATMLGVHETLHAIPAEAQPVELPRAALLAESAVHRRPEHAYYRRSIEAARSSANASSLHWAPTLSAFGNAQAFNYRGFSGDSYSWAVGLQLDWTLYDGGIRDAQRRNAWAQRREHEARLELLNETVVDDVVNARRALATKRLAVQSAVRAAQLSGETLRLVRFQYEAGKGTQLDLLQAQDSLVAAEVAVAQARFALALADLELRRSAGTFPGAR
jgi:outer membrane protein TolC